MNDKNDNLSSPSGDPAEELLQQLFHLKRYERPDPVRMNKNRQNIMRQVREIQSRKRRSLTDLVAVNVPWFFAEPRYGIAALFIVFASLQFVGFSANRQVRDNADIYSGNDSVAATTPMPASIQAAMPVNTVYTNHIYPSLPDDINFAPGRQSDNSGIKFVGRRIE